MTTVQQALREAKAHGVDALDAQCLLAHQLVCSREWLLARGDMALTAPQQAFFRAGVARRAAGEPLAYLLGEKEFHGLMLSVDARVLVPRPDTETLVDWALEILKDEWEGVVTAAEVVDLGTGSGAIALALKHAQPRLRMTAVDASAPALDVACRNAAQLRLNIQLLAGNWWAPLKGRRFHLAVSNPPYIADDDPHLAALSHEPQNALRAGVDGLRDLQCIVSQAPHHLVPGGWLLLEHGWRQADDVSTLLRDHGFHGIQTRHDLGQNPRCTAGQYGLNARDMSSA